MIQQVQLTEVKNSNSNLNLNLVKNTNFWVFEWKVGDYFQEKFGLDLYLTNCGETSIGDYLINNWGG